MWTILWRLFYWRFHCVLPLSYPNPHNSLDESWQCRFFVPGDTLFRTKFLTHSSKTSHADLLNIVITKCLILWELGRVGALPKAGSECAELVSGFKEMLIPSFCGTIGRHFCWIHPKVPSSPPEAPIQDSFHKTRKLIWFSNCYSQPTSGHWTRYGDEYQVHRQPQKTQTDLIYPIVKVRDASKISKTVNCRSQLI